MYSDIENTCANGGAWCPTNALPPPAKGVFEWAAEQTLDWSFLDDDPATGPKPKPAAAGSSPPTTVSGRDCATNNGGREYSERELKEAENELRRNKDFRNWFHRNYKADVVKPVGDRSNPDLDRDQVREAYEEWIECGKPRSK